MISLAITPLTSSDCTDAGPWPCDVAGCPSPEVSCVDLVSLDYCAATIDTADIQGTELDGEQMGSTKARSIDE